MNDNDDLKQELNNENIKAPKTEVINRGNESYLYNFSSSELAIIRNTLYARRGYRFKKKKYQQYFGSKPWYTPTTDSQNILPKNEERLANIIKKYE